MSAPKLPEDAKPGQMFSFTSAPGLIYFMGADGVWRALLLVPEEAKKV